ncbi:hypothetical protein P7228_04685 [Altererythrobacter arenosus]|uniref:Thermonuclease family protein n=1 Tax=Altererythrobacter arenosus TaxID=3032592 RepID=A0ABY8FWM6_9SPHN|nr:hypothetical protein [Altererythrobacter sp. CAU 1644]WFL78363.1 hypothetical protein P7228_04685 [Altererythrobacter sp. CAU 1644]
MSRFARFRRRAKGARPGTYRSPLIRRRRRRTRWWPAARIGLLVGVLIGTWWIVNPPRPTEWQTVSPPFGTCGARGRPFQCVTDGDTVTLGYGEGARRIRLKGFDAPEVAGACPNEQMMAARATAALHNWLNRGAFEWDGGMHPPRDKYGRELRSARRTLPDGSYEKLAEWMIGQGLAEGEAIWESKDWCG